MTVLTGNHVVKNRRCSNSMRCCATATMDYGTDPISSFVLHNIYIAGQRNLDVYIGRYDHLCIYAMMHLDWRPIYQYPLYEI